MVENKKCKILITTAALHLFRLKIGTLMEYSRSIRAISRHLAIIKIEVSGL